MNLGTEDPARRRGNPFYGLKRWIYRDGRPHGLARAMNELTAWSYARGWLTMGRGALLEVVGRRTGRAIRVPVVVADYEGDRFLVSMLGQEAGWVRNVRAADGRAVLISRGRHAVCLTEVPASDRAPILRRYLDLAPGARPHLPVHRTAPTTDFAAIADHYPVFRILPATSTPPLTGA